MWGENITIAFFWCLACGALPLVVCLKKSEAELGLAAFIGIASLAAVGGCEPALLMSVVLTVMLHRERRFAATGVTAGRRLSDRPTRVKWDNRP